MVILGTISNFYIAESILEPLKNVTVMNKGNGRKVFTLETDGIFSWED